MNFIIAIVVLGAAALYWRSSQQCKQIAINHARRECNKHGVQLLDQTVQQIKLSMSRDEQGKWRFWREYRFEYSRGGDDRYEGRLLLLGKRLIRMAVEQSGPTIH